MLDKILKSNKQDKQAEKQLEKFIPDVDVNIKSKLQSLATKGHGSNAQPKIITLDEIKKAFSEWKLENQIFNSDVTLSHCKELSLSFQRILQISNLENLTSLEKVKLDNNMIMKIENLDKLKNLKWLDLSFNSISKMQGLDSLTNLQDLSLYNNQISEVEGLDNCRKINVLSLGRNNIKSVKELVSYLRKFMHLQALNVAENPFCKDESANQQTIEQTMQQKSIVYHASYEAILANLDHLNYLDWKPIDDSQKKAAIENNKSSNQKDKNEAHYLNELKQQELMKDYIKYKHANIEATIDLYKNFEKKIKEDLVTNASGLETWEKLRKLPGFVDCLDNLNKSIEISIKAYREDILEIQEKRDILEKQRLKEIEDGHEKFVMQSKALVSDFKREFKSLTLNLPPQQVNREKIDGEIKKLTDRLMEIQLWEKQKIAYRIGEFKTDYLKDYNEKMSNRTSSLKDTLDEHKKSLKESLQAIQQDYEKKLEAYQSDENPDKIKSELIDFYLKLADDESIWNEIERINETYEEKINGLREELDRARENATTEFFLSLNEKEFARNKKRIEDIVEISEMYNEKLLVCIGADTKKK